MSGGIVAAAPRKAAASDERTIGVSARSVREGAREPATLARGENLSQARTVANTTTPARDSLLEDLRLAQEHVPHLDWLWQDMGRRLRTLWDSNVREGRHEVAIAGWSDRLAVELHAGELAGRAVGIKRTAELLRGPLGVLRDASPEVVAAVREADAVLTRTARHRLLCDSMANALGPVKTSTLRRLCGEPAA